MLFHTRRFLDANSEPGFGVADPNAEVDPSPGQKGVTAFQKAVQQLRSDVREGKVAYADQRADRDVQSTLEKHLEAGAGAADDTEDGSQGDADDTVDDTADDSQEGAADEVDAGEGDEGAEGDDAADDTTVDEDKLKVTLKGRNPDDPPIEIVAPDEETAERMRQNLRDGLRRDEFNRRVERVVEREEQAAYLDHLLKHDPAGFLAQRVPEEVQQQVVERLLAQPGMLEKVQAKLEEWEGSPEKRTNFRLEQDVNALKNSEKVDSEFEAERVARNATRVLMDTCDTLAGAVPTDMAHQFVDDVLRDVQQFYIRENRGTPLKPEEIVAVISPRLKLYGLTPEKAKGLLNGDPSPIPKAKPDAAAAERLKQDAKQGARKLVRASQGRKAAATVAGAGTPPGARPAAPPKGQGLKDRFAWVRQSLGLPKR